MRRRGRASGRTSRTRRSSMMLAEVRTWAHLRMHGVEAELLEEDGMPDIRVHGGSEASWIEVKYVHPGTTDNGVASALKKANRQIRNASPDRSGVVYLFVGTDRVRRALPNTPAEAEAAKLPSGEDPAPDIVSRRRLRGAPLGVRSLPEHGARAGRGLGRPGLYRDEREGMLHLVRRQTRVRLHPSPHSRPLTAEELTLGLWDGDAPEGNRSGPS